MKKKMIGTISCVLVALSTGIAYGGEVGVTFPLPEAGRIVQEEMGSFNIGLRYLQQFAAQDTIIEPYRKIILSLDENAYGGVYMKDNVLHIKPLTENRQFRLPHNLDSIHIIYDTVATYSVKELSEAQEKAEEIFEDLGLDFVAIDDENNGLYVGVKDLTEDVKKRFEEAVGINNVRYKEVGETIEDESLLPQVGSAEVFAATEVINAKMVIPLMITCKNVKTLWI